MNINQLQQVIDQVSKTKGFDGENLEQKFMLLFEEVGELAKSTRGTVGSKISKHSKNFEAGDEESDVLYVLLDICNKLGINLENSFSKKLKIIQNRRY